MITAAVERFAQRATALAERWMPDAFVFALAATLLCLGAAYAVDPAMRAAPTALVRAWGEGFWTLIPFTLQMAMIIIGGSVLASAPPVRRAISALAGLPRDPKAAVAMVALVAMLTSLLNWGFSLIFSAFLALEVGRRLPRACPRALAAAGFLGLGTVWAQGLSGSAALQMASASSMPKALVSIVGEPIPLTETIFRWQSAVCVGVELVVVTALAWAIAPRERSGSAAPPPPPAQAAVATPATPGERLEHSPLLLFPVVLLGFVYLGLHIAERASSLSGALNALDFNTINLFFLLLGALLHRTPAALGRAVQDAVPSVAGILLQFPFYAGIFGIMTGTALSGSIAGLFVRAVDATLYPALILAYSAVLGLFVPSGGSKWVIEAPYVLDAARQLGVSDGWMVVTYDLGEALANLCQPFWMLPILALHGLKAREIMGYTWMVAAVLFPVCLLLVTLLRP